MKKLNYLVILFVLTLSLGSAQIGVNTEIPDNTSILDVVSSDKGVLFPRMTTTVRNQQLATAAVGLMLYNTTEKCLNINVGTRDLPVWECLKESEAPSGGSGRTIAWGAYTGLSGSFPLGSDGYDRTSPPKNSRTALFSDYSTVFGVDAKLSGYGRFVSYKFNDLTASQLGIGVDFLDERFDIVSTSTSTTTGLVNNIHPYLKQFADRNKDKKVVVITLTNNVTEDAKVFSAHNISTVGMTTNVPSAVGISVAKDLSSPNAKFENLPIGSELSVPSAKVVGFPTSSLPANAVVYAVENSVNNAVVFSIDNVFFFGSMFFHEGSFNLNPATLKDKNSALFNKKITALILDKVSN